MLWALSRVIGSCLASKSNGRVADRRRQRWRSGLSLARLRKLPPVREGATVATDPPVDPDRYRRFHVESCSPNASHRRPAAKAGSRRNAGTRELLLARQFFEDAGDRGRGRHVFTAKHCSVCHREGSAAGAPNLTPRVIRSRPPLWSQPCGATVRTCSRKCRQKSSHGLGLSGPKWPT